MSIKSESFQNLLENLEGLIKAYRLLLDIVRKEKELLIEVDIDKLNENNAAKEVVLKKLRHLENQRVANVRAIASDLGIVKESIRVSDLINAADDSQAEILRQKQSVLDLLIKRVIENNRGNEDLAKSALKSTTGALDAIRGALNEKPTYERKGNLNQGASEGGHLVRREV